MFASSANPSGRGNRGVVAGIGSAIDEEADLVIEGDDYVRSTQPHATPETRYEQGVMVSFVDGSGARAGAGIEVLGHAGAGCDSKGDRHRPHPGESRSTVQQLGLSARRVSLTRTIMNEQGRGSAVTDPRPCSLPPVAYGLGLITRPQVLLLPQMFWRSPSSWRIWV